METLLTKQLPVRLREAVSWEDIAAGLMGGFKTNFDVRKVYRSVTTNAMKEKPSLQPCAIKKQAKTESYIISSVSEFSVPPVPVNSFQLESDFRKLKSYPDQLYTYLKQIDPSLYPNLFQKSLDPEVFCKILKILQDFHMKKEEPLLILEILHKLSESKRFDMAVMFMSESEKKIVRCLFDHLEQSHLEDSPIKQLKIKYSI